MILALLLGILVVIAAPILVPPTLRLWTMPMARIGAVWQIARRSASWRSELGANAVALLTLSLTFIGAMVSATQTSATTAQAAQLQASVNQVDTYVLAGVMALLAGSGGIAIIAMTSRAREREFATLRCAGATSGHLTVQALAEPALYVGTALVLSVVPITVSTVGEAWFFTRAGLHYAPAPAILQTLLVAAAAYLVLATAMLLPARRALTTPINTALAAE